MPKIKTTRHKDKTSHSSKGIKKTIMEKVKIKRVKRNKKKITTAEKIMAGIGVGSTLMGGVGAVAPQSKTTQFERTNSASSSGVSQRIKAQLGRIFGIGSAQAAGPSVADAQAQLNTVLAQLGSDSVAVSNAQVAVVSAETTLTQAQASLLSATENLAQAQAAVTNTINTDPGYAVLLSQLVEAQTAQTSAQQAVTTAQTALNTASAAVTSAQTVVTNDQQALAAAQAALQAAQAGSSTGTTPPAAGTVAEKYKDAQLIAGINSIQYTGSTDIPNEQLQRIQPEVTIPPSGVVPGTVLAFMLGLGDDSPPANTPRVGSDGKIYTYNNGVWTPGGSATSPSTGPIANNPLNAGNINTIPYDSSYNADISALNLTPNQVLAATANGVVPGTVLAFMLGLGGASTNGTTMVGSDSNIYTYNNGMWTKTEPADGPSSTPPAPGANPLNIGNINMVIYAPALNGDITALNLTAAQIQTAAANGVNPGSVLAFMLGLGDDNPKVGTLRDGYTYNGTTWTLAAQAGTLTFSTGSGNTKTPSVGDTWTINIQGAAPNTNVYVTGGLGTSSGTSLEGQTNAQGNFTLTSSSPGQTVFSSSDVGTWTESWSVGASPTTATPVANGSFNFTVQKVATPTFSFTTGSGNTGNVSVNDNYTVSIANATPGAPVVLFALKNGVLVSGGPISEGNIGPNGNFTQNGSFSALGPGNWQEIWGVGNLQVGDINFIVQGPATPAPAPVYPLPPATPTTPTVPTTPSTPTTPTTPAVPTVPVTPTASVTSLSLSSQSVNIEVGANYTVQATVGLSNGQSDYNVSATSNSANVSVTVGSTSTNPTSGNITITGLATTGSTPAIVTVHPSDLPASNTSRDMTISVNVSGAMANASGASYINGAEGGSSALYAPGFITTSLPNGSIGQLYGGTIELSSYGPTSFSVSGNLPPGLSLMSNGAIDGTPTASGTFTFVIKATNSQGSSQQEFTITIPGSGGGSVTGESLNTELAPASVTAPTGLQMPVGLQMPPGYPASGGGLQMPTEVLGANVSSNNQAYTVKKGDTLLSISKKFYGTGNNWRKILSANPNSLSIPGNTKTLKIGAQLTIPNIN